MTSPFAPPAGPQDPHVPENTPTEQGSTARHGARATLSSPGADHASESGIPGTPVQGTTENPGRPGSVAAFVCSLVVWPAGLILGIRSLARSRRAGSPAVGLSIAAVVISGLWAVIVLITVLALASALGNVSDGLDPLPAAELTLETNDGEPIAADQTTGEDALTCDALVADIVTLTPSHPFSPQLLAIYEVVTTADHVDAYAAGELTVPEGETDVAVLECTGLGSFDNGSKHQIAFGATVDVYDEVFVSYEVIDGLE